MLAPIARYEDALIGVFNIADVSVVEQVGRHGPTAACARPARCNAASAAVSGCNGGMRSRQCWPPTCNSLKPAL